MTIKTFTEFITHSEDDEIDKILSRFENKEILNISIVPTIRISSFGSSVSGKSQIILYVIYKE